MQSESVNVTNAVTTQSNRRRTGHDTEKFTLAVVKYTSICIALYHDSSLTCSGMARVNEGSHSFTWHTHVYPQVE